MSINDALNRHGFSGLQDVIGKGQYGEAGLEQIAKTNFTQGGGEMTNSDNVGPNLTGMGGGTGGPGGGHAKFSIILYLLVFIAAIMFIEYIFIGYIADCKPR